jgi:hypothetical protein
VALLNQVRAEWARHKRFVQAILMPAAREADQAAFRHSRSFWPRQRVSNAPRCSAGLGGPAGFRAAYAWLINEATIAALVVDDWVVRTDWSNLNELSVRDWTSLETQPPSTLVGRVESRRTWASQLNTLHNRPQ